MSDTEGVPVALKRPPLHWQKTRAIPKAEGWRYANMWVLSRVALVTRESGKREIVWFLSISKTTAAAPYPTNLEVHRVLTEFEMEDAKETGGCGAEPAKGRWRHFVLPVPTEPEPI